MRSQAVNTAVHGWANQTADDEEDENCTVGYYAQVLGVEPVVGWLVCIRGAYRGESFRLKSGRNFIGRAANMDIVLGADHSVSRLRHAAVVYDPRSRAFIVAAGDARELCYLNGEVVITSNIMKAYDVLKPWQYRFDADASLRRALYVGCRARERNPMIQGHKLRSVSKVSIGF